MSIDRYVVFVGVDTRRSRALDAVPDISERLGHRLRVEPLDVPLGAPRAVYTRIFDEIQADPAAAGAVVTAHKVRMYAAVAGRCAFVSPDAARLRECTVLAARPSGMVAHATDVRSIGTEVDRIWPVGGTVLCLGAGGSAAALCLHLLRRSIPPSQIVVCERDANRSAEFLRLFPPNGVPSGVEVQVLSGADAWDDAVASTPPGSLVVNATGLGKTAPVSPLSPATLIPRRSTVWDLNYRGPLPFLALARHQARDRQLAVHDGAHLFELGWLAALTALLDVEAAAGVAGDRARSGHGGQP